MADPRITKDVDDNIVIKNGAVVPENDNSKDLGRSTKQWKDVYFKGSLKDAANSLSLAQIINHSARHENTGADEINVVGLSGELADNQPPKAHASSHNAGGGDVLALTISSTNTLTNKRITKRVNTVASSATPTPAGDTTDIFTVTALAEAATFAAPTGTPTNGQALIIRIKDNGTARALAYNALYREGEDIKFPTETVAGKTMYIALMWNSTDNKWDLTGKVMNI